jgi:hypothetical protein
MLYRKEDSFKLISNRTKLLVLLEYIFPTDEINTHPIVRILCFWIFLWRGGSSCVCFGTGD